MPTTPTRLIFKHSFEEYSSPDPNSIAPGELAINVPDAKIYFKDINNQLKYWSLDYKSEISAYISQNHNRDFINAFEYDQTTGNLIVLFKDGSRKTIGIVKGEKGDGLKINGVVDYANQLPLPSGITVPGETRGVLPSALNVTGTIFTVRLGESSGSPPYDRAHIWLYTNDASLPPQNRWADIGSLQGAQGPTGPAGIQGINGTAGGTGATGPTGPPGPQTISLPNTSETFILTAQGAAGTISPSTAKTTRAVLGTPYVLSSVVSSADFPGSTPEVGAAIFDNPISGTGATGVKNSVRSKYSSITAGHSNISGLNSNSSVENSKTVMLSDNFKIANTLTDQTGFNLNVKTTQNGTCSPILYYTYGGGCQHGTAAANGISGFLRIEKLSGSTSNLNSAHPHRDFITEARADAKPAQVSFKVRSISSTESIQFQVSESIPYYTHVAHRVKLALLFRSSGSLEIWSCGVKQTAISGITFGWSANDTFRAVFSDQTFSRDPASSAIQGSSNGLYVKIYRNTTLIHTISQQGSAASPVFLGDWGISDYALSSFQVGFNSLGGYGEFSDLEISLQNIYADASLVSGGRLNTSIGEYSSVGGGESGLSSGRYSSVSGGSSNFADGARSTVGGGRSNRASGVVSTVGGGSANIAKNVHSTVGGGANNVAFGDGSVVAGGSNLWDFIGGSNNIANGRCSSILGGENNEAYSYYSTIGGGKNNLIPLTDPMAETGGEYSSILGGHDNNTAAYENVHIIGSGITADQPNTTFVNNIKSSGDIEAAQDLYVARDLDVDRDLYLTPGTAIKGAVNGDRFFDSVSLLMRMDSGQPYVDRSPTPVVMTATPTVSTSTTVKKFGSSSLYFNGSGSRVSGPNLPDFQFGTGDFAIEMWVRPDPNPTGYQTLFTTRSSDPGQNTSSLWIGLNLNSLIPNVGSITTMSPLVSGVWNHLAFSRTNGFTRLYLNGNLVGSATDNTSYTVGFPTLGGTLANGDYFKGYIGELRVTKGTSRGLTGSTIPIPTTFYPDRTPIADDASDLTKGTLDTARLPTTLERQTALGSSGTARTLSVEESTVLTCTLSAACTFTMPTLRAGQSFKLILQQSSSAAYAVSWAATPPVYWIPNDAGINPGNGWTPAVGTKWVINFVSDGTTWYGGFSGLPGPAGPNSLSRPAEIPGATGISNIVQISQTAYDALPTVDPSVIYIIIS